MNTRRPIHETAPKVALSASFNRDNSCFSVGHESGFNVYLTEGCKLKEAQEFESGIGSAEMLDTTNFIALIGGGTRPKYPQNKVVIWDAAKQKVAITMEFNSLVQRVRLSRSYIVVVLEYSVQIHRFASPPEKLGEFETASNPFGLCCLGQAIAAFPGRTAGQIQLVELPSRNVSIIPAHSSALRALDISPDGEILVSASEVGTLVRVFATTNCARIGELRRGRPCDDLLDGHLVVQPSASRDFGQVYGAHLRASPSNKRSYDTNCSHELTG